MNIYTDSNKLIIKFEGFEKILAIKNQLVIQKPQIITIKWHEVINISRRELGWRVGGTAIPKIILAGRFAGLSGINFIYLKHPNNIMALKSAQLNSVLEIDTCDYRYKKLLLSFDKPEIAAELIEWSMRKVSQPVS